MAAPSEGVVSESSGADVSTDEVPDASGGAGTKRDARGRPKKPFPSDYMLFLKEARIEKLIQDAHASGEDKQMFLHFCEAVSDPRTDTHWGSWMARNMQRSFRFGLDPTKHQDQMVLYEYNGVRYVARSANTLANMKCAAMAAAKKVTRNLLTLLETADEKAGEGQEDEEGGEGQGADEGGGAARVTAKLLSLRLQEVLAKLHMSPYVEKVFNSMKAVMMTDAFYKELELPTPADFWHKLDADSDLFGYENGIMNLNEPDRSFKFYQRGEVPRHFVITYSCGLAYDGPSVIPPGDTSLTWEQRAGLWGPDHPAFTDEQRTRMKEIEDATIRKFFFAPASYLAAVFLLGSIMFGTKRSKRLPCLLGARGNNGKSRLVAMLQLTLGDYAGTLKKTAVVERKGAALDNPDAASPFLVDCYKKKVVFASETDKADKLNEGLVKQLSGGDKITIRANYGNPFQTVFSPLMMFVSNNAPGHSGASAMTDRFYGISCDATFTSTCEQEDPANGIWKAMPQADFEAIVSRHKRDLARLHVSYARLFADAGFALPPAPASDATDALAEAATGASFEEWFLETYETTLKKNPATGMLMKEVDWDLYGADGATDLRILIRDYEYRFPDEPISSRDAKDCLRRLGFPVAKVVVPARFCENNRTYTLQHGVKARKKPDDDAGEASGSEQAREPPVGDAVERANVELALRQSAA